MRRLGIIEEVRKYRQEHAARFGYDIKRIIRDLQRREKKSGHKVVHPPSKRVTGS